MNTFVFVVQSFLMPVLAIIVAFLAFMMRHLAIRLMIAEIEIAALKRVLGVHSVERQGPKR